MRISAVIPTYNRRDALEGCLTTLLEQDLPRDRYEIVVVVDGSSDGTIEMLNSFKARGGLVVVEQENRGQTAALNAGVNAAVGDIVVFLDDDLLCDRGLLFAHVVAHEGGSSALVFGRMCSVLSQSPAFAETLMHADLEKYYSRLETDSRPKWPDDAWAGPNCSMPRAVFLAAGGYDENLFPRRGEDVDLGLRLWKTGLPFRFESQAVTLHRWVKSDHQFWADAQEDGVCAITLCHKHPEMRSHSALMGVMNASGWKRYAAKSAASLPAAAIILGRLTKSFESVASLLFAQKLGLRLFLITQNIAALAGARRNAGSWRLLKQLFGQRVAVLLYHHVGIPTAKTTELALTVTPKQFQRQIRWLRWRGYVPITPMQWLAWRSAGQPIPNKAIMVTFDDAYADIAEYALPVLDRYGLSGAVFVITAQTGRSNTWDGLQLMTIEQLRYWAARGIEVGAHTRTHPDLTLVSTSSIAAEVAGSKEDLMECGFRSLSFAYPYGYFDSKVRKSLEGVFPLAFTCEEGLNSLRTDPLLLRRTMVQPGDTLVDIELRAAFGRSPLTALRSRLRVRSRFLRILRYVGLSH